MLFSNEGPANTTTTTDVGDIMAAYNAFLELAKQHKLRQREWRKSATLAELVDEMRVREAIELNVFHPFTMGTP